MQTGDFHGHKTVVLENEHFRLECLAEAGPRIVRLIPNWTGENLFAELPKMNEQSPRGLFNFYGGHRLWIAPESYLRTYAPDDYGVSIKEIQGGIRIAGRDDTSIGIRKSVTIQMSSNQPFVIIKHKLQNIGNQPIKLAPWALTMMRPKGVAILPQQIGNADGNILLPNRKFSLWSYSRLHDPRLQLGDEFITVQGDAVITNPFKIGYFNPHGWLGYVYDDVIFVKRFGVRRDEEYPDFGCNAEVYVNARFLELESLAPLVEIAPQGDVVHTETWEVYDINAIPKELLGGKAVEEIIKK